MVHAGQSRLARKIFWEVCAVGRARLLPSRLRGIQVVNESRLSGSRALSIRQIHNLASRADQSSRLDIH
ncbi:MAG: hypothetical protein DWH91_12790 [Planctomycetota bacterium]|nr:MAG: hypothetical protein DWH91_12790 [Planctomycetota bacterium]